MFLHTAWIKVMDCRDFPLIYVHLISKLLNDDSFPRCYMFRLKTFKACWDVDAVDVSLKSAWKLRHQQYQESSSNRLKLHLIQWDHRSLHSSSNDLFKRKIHKHKNITFECFSKNKNRKNMFIIKQAEVPWKYFIIHKVNWYRKTNDKKNKKNLPKYLNDGMMDEEKFKCVIWCRSLPVVLPSLRCVAFLYLLSLWHRKLAHLTVENLLPPYLCHQADENSNLREKKKQSRQCDKF